MRKYSYTINGAAYDVRIDSIKNGVAKVNVNGLDFDVQNHGNLCEEDLTAPSVSSENIPLQAVASGQKPQAASEPQGVSTKGETAPGAGEGILAPLPGVITKILVSAGQKVKKGDTILVLEAMKMENNIQAEHDGTVTAVCCKAGDSVMEGTTLVTIQ